MHFKASLAIGAVASLLAVGIARAENRVAVPPTQAPPTQAPPTQAPPAGYQPGNAAHEAAAPTIRDLVVKHAHDNGVPVGLANAVIKIESRFNPQARNGGALGLMQIKADTARNVGFDGATGALLTPDTNLRYGMKILAQAYRASGGDVCRTLAFYQSGHQVHRFSRAQRSYCAMARSFMARA